MFCVAEPPQWQGGHPGTDAPGKGQGWQLQDKGGHSQEQVCIDFLFHILLVQTMLRRSTCALDELFHQRMLFELPGSALRSGSELGR